MNQCSHRRKGRLRVNTSRVSATMVSSRVRRNAPSILALEKASQAVKSAMLSRASKDFVLALVEIAHNVISGGVRITNPQLAALRRHKRNIRELLNKKTTLSRRKSLLQKGGFLGLLLSLTHPNF